jgi:acylphosphatase
MRPATCLCGCLHAGRVARAHVWVSGKVQGVFYRDSTKQEAAKRGVRGWVRNLKDGRVEAVFEGPPEAVDAMVAWCRVGSPLSRPTFVDRRDEAEEGLAVFEIRPTA